MYRVALRHLKVAPAFNYICTLCDRVLPRYVNFLTTNILWLLTAKGVLVIEELAVL